MRTAFVWLAGLVIVLAILAIYRGCSRPPLHVARYRCIVYGVHEGVHNEILCFDADGRMFRPERRFNKFILEDGEE